MMYLTLSNNFFGSRGTVSYSVEFGEGNAVTFLQPYRQGFFLPK